MSGSIKRTRSNVTKHLEDIIKRGSAFPQWVVKVGHNMLAIEEKRIFEEAGPGWKPLEPLYAKQKLTRFASYLGSGEKINIATAKLYEALTFQSMTNINETIGDSSWVVKVSLDYAGYVNDARSFQPKDETFKKAIRASYRQYFLRGRITSE